MHEWYFLFIIKTAQKVDPEMRGKFSGPTVYMTHIICNLSEVDLIPGQNFGFWPIKRGWSIPYDQSATCTNQMVGTRNDTILGIYIKNGCLELRHYDVGNICKRKRALWRNDKCRGQRKGSPLHMLWCSLKKRQTEDAIKGSQYFKANSWNLWWIINAYSR